VKSYQRIGYGFAGGKMEKKCCFNCTWYNGSAYKNGGGKVYCGVDNKNKVIEKNIKSYKCKRFTI